MTTTQSNVQREKLLERVRALLAMTTKNGCTEAEAMTASRDGGQASPTLGSEAVERKWPDGLRGICGSEVSYRDDGMSSL